MSRHAMPRPHPIVGMLLAATGSRPRVEVSPETLLVSLGWSFRIAIPRAAVREVAAVPGRRLSIGAHGWRGRWLVNTATGPLVRVGIDPAAPARILGVPIRVHELTVSVVDVEALLSDLR